jgi:hypothetical protein
MPATKSVSPKRKVGKPKKTSPKKRTASPKKRTASPKKKTASPKKKTASPKKRVVKKSTKKTSPGRPRKVGRPLGSKNKKKSASPKKKPGRPKGSRTRRGALTNEQYEHLNEVFMDRVYHNGKGGVTDKYSLQQVGFAIQGHKSMSDIVDTLDRAIEENPDHVSLKDFRDKTLYPLAFPQQERGSGGTPVGFGY